jgi:hypothetical protein
MSYGGASFFGSAYWGNLLGSGATGGSPSSLSVLGSQFFRIKIAEFIEEAYQRINFDVVKLNAMHMASARRSLNFLYTQWNNMNLNLYSVEYGFLQLIPNQVTYALPVDTIDVLQCLMRTFTRPTGTYYSLIGGTAANAFDNNLATTCTQTLPDGFIAVDYGSSNEQTINMVGICSYTDNSYTLEFEYSSDGVTWTSIASIEETDYTAFETLWYTINAPVQAQWFRVRETGGATLNIAEAYYVTQPVDAALGRISRSNFVNVANKFSPGRSSAFMVNRLREPTISLYPPSTSSYILLVYARIKSVASVDTSAEELTIPQRWYDAAVAGLASRLARKFRPEMAQELAAEAEIAFNIAAAEDRDRAPLSILPNMSGMS